MLSAVGGHVQRFFLFILKFCTVKSEFKEPCHFYERRKLTVAMIFQCLTWSIDGNYKLRSIVWNLFRANLNEERKQ